MNSDLTAGKPTKQQTFTARQQKDNYQKKKPKKKITLHLSLPLLPLYRLVRLGLCNPTMPIPAAGHMQQDKTLNDSNRIEHT